MQGLVSTSSELSKEYAVCTRNDSEQPQVGQADVHMFGCFRIFRYRPLDASFDSLRPGCLEDAPSFSSRLATSGVTGTLRKHGCVCPPRSVNQYLIARRRRSCWHPVPKETGWTLLTRPSDASAVPVGRMVSAGTPTLQI